MYKCIFVHFPHSSKGGLPIIDERNKSVLRGIVSALKEVEFHPFSIGKTSVVRAFLFKILFFLGWKPYKKLCVQPIIDDKEKILYFFSHSFFGLYAKYIRSVYPNIKIASFFHNIESDYQKQLIKKHRLSAVYYYFMSMRAEKNTIRYSDVIFVLNQRDSDLLFRIYGFNKAVLLPTTLEDRFERSKKRQKEANSKLKVLFVGTFFASNIDGVKWLANNIAPYVNVEFNIVGRGMDKLTASLLSHPNMHIVGEVDSETLDGFYYDADIFISTLFSGGGMKTKIAEAMMFALPVIGTEEAFQGYDINHSLIGIKSDTANDIISFIKRVDENRNLLEAYSKQARKYFVEKYSYSSSFGVLNDALMKG